jgi:uncharacterized protein YdaU (DUF1376 family)
MSEPLVFFRFYPSDFMDSEKVAKMNAAERGVYTSALCWQWREGSIPDDPDALAPLVRLKPGEVKRAWPVVRSCFTVREDGRLVQPRLETERSAATDRLRKARESGQRGGRASAATRKDNEDDELGEGCSRQPQGTLEGLIKAASTYSTTNKTSIYNNNNNKASLDLDVVDLEKIGVTREKAEQLVRDFGDRVRVQLDALPNRRRVDDPAAYVIRAIEEDYPPSRKQSRNNLGLSSDDPSFERHFGPSRTSKIPRVNPPADPFANARNEKYDPTVHS